MFLLILSSLSRRVGERGHGLLHIDACRLCGVCSPIVRLLLPDGSSPVSRMQERGEYESSYLTSVRVDRFADRTELDGIRVS